MVNEENKFVKSVTDLFKRIGNHAGKAFEKGLEEQIPSTERSQKEFYQGILDSEKEFLEEKARLESEQDQLAEDKYQKSYQRKLQTAKNANQVMTAQMNETYRTQKKANDAYIQSVAANLKQIEEQIKRYQQQIMTDFNEIAKSATDSLESLEQSQLKMEEKMQEYGGLFQHQTLTFVNTGQYGETENVERFIPEHCSLGPTNETSVFMRVCGVVVRSSML